MYSYDIVKYPRTQHLEGSRLQAGDEDLSQVPFDEILGRHIVIEEKIDGANTGVSFDGDGNLLLQSRGHYLIGGYRERHYNLFKQWANFLQDDLFDVLGDRYVMYGEWMYAKHTVYYDALPHYFMEFDIYDRETGIYLDTPSRRNLLKGFPICSVPVIGSGVYTKKEDVLKLLAHSNYITDDAEAHLRQEIETQKIPNVDQILGETEFHGTMEGLYIKVEDQGQITRRVKFVRREFVQHILSSDSHWIDRPIIPNRLARPLDEVLYGR